jgi:hypothetical protein
LPNAYTCTWIEFNGKKDIKTQPRRYPDFKPLSKHARVVGAVAALGLSRRSIDVTICWTTKIAGKQKAALQMSFSKSFYGNINPPICIAYKGPIATMTAREPGAFFRPKPMFDRTCIARLRRRKLNGAAPRKQDTAS